MRAPLSARRSRLRSAAAAASIVVALAVSACSSSGAGQSSTAVPPVTTTSAAGQTSAAAPSGPSAVSSASGSSSGGAAGTDARSLLPEKFKAGGVIKVGSTFGYPPNQFMDTDGKTPIGFEVDLSASIAKKLGLTASWQDSPFENLITSLQANRVDMTIAAMNDRPDR